MKLTTKIVEKIGADRLLHLLVCACIVLAGGYLGELGVFIAFCVAVILSVLKEYVFDEEADAVDCFCGFAGAALGVVWWIIFAVILQ